MFDITSYIREKIFRRSKLVAETAGEDLTEKQTTKLGYFLLYCMFGAIILSAQWTLSIIKDIPDRPTPVAYCITTMVNSFENNTSYSRYSNLDNCELSSNNPEFNFSPEYNSLLKPFKEISDIMKNIDSLESTKRSLESSETKSQEDYNTSLTEKIARENSGLYDKDSIQKNISDSRSEIVSTQNKINSLHSEIKEIKLSYKDDLEKLKQKLEKANDDYKTAYLLYRLYIAILSFIFSLIVFFILYKIYVKQKIKNSPYAIIFSVATFAYGLILLQVAALFIWDIIPNKLLKLVIDFIKIFSPLVYLVQFLWPILIISIFGFLVYKIQKRLYSPKNVLKRFVSDKKCPNCGNGVDINKPFCPLCSHEIQISCPSCKKLTLKGMPYCSSCGGKLKD